MTATPTIIQPENAMKSTVFTLMLSKSALCWLLDKKRQPDLRTVGGLKIVFQKYYFHVSHLPCVPLNFSRANLNCAAGVAKNVNLRRKFRLQ